MNNRYISNPFAERKMNRLVKWDWKYNYTLYIFIYFYIFYIFYILLYILFSYT
jgi:hypothetical protein